jgi:hypothetical protein
VNRAWRIAGIAVAALLAMGALGLAYARASQRPSPMEQADVARVAERITSLASEGRLLAELVLADRLTEHYARAHLEHLGQEVHDQEAELDRPPPPGLDVQPLRDVRARLQEEVTQARRHLSEAGSMKRIRAEFARIHDDALAQAPPK